jgi:type II secretory pathway pseudopilin PulG
VRRRTFRGLTLLEALLTMFLFALALAVVSKLVTGSQQLVRQSEGRSQALRTCQWALSEIRQQVEGAAKLDSPTSGTANSLVLTVFKEGSGRLPDRLPLWRPGRDPYWNPFDPAHLESLEFSLNADQLMKISGGSSLFLASSVDSFWVEALDEQLRIEIVVKGRVKESRFVSRVMKP